MQNLIYLLRLLTLFLVELFERHLAIHFVVFYLPFGLFGTEKSQVKEIFSLLVDGLTRV